MLTLWATGVHPPTPLSLMGAELYDKNVSLSFGRCPVRARAVWDGALGVLSRRYAMLDKPVSF